MIRLVLAVLALLISPGSQAQDRGRFVEIAAAPTSRITPPHVVVWLPPGYDASTRRYGVVYMHDGQNLFFPDRSNFKKVWAADTSALRLIAAKRVEPFIIVGIDQPGPARYRRYFPQAIYEIAPTPVRAEIERLAGGTLVGDAYLDFIVHDLKPTIDRDYRTLPEAQHTAVVGSSMGGLISIDAFMQYPNVFGRAGCVSMHVPLADTETVASHRAEVIATWRAYLHNNLGKPRRRKLWMDHGTQTLDATYAMYQEDINSQIARLGWRRGRDFESRIYDGAAHEENAWAARLDEVFSWLLK